MHSSHPTFRILHTLRLRGVSALEGLASALGNTSSEISAMLTPLTDEGLARERSGGRLEGWALTKDGRARHTELLAQDRADGDLPAVLEPHYRRFLEVNQVFIDLCSDWQVRADDGGTNDHSDAAYDAAILERLERVHVVGVQAATDSGAVVERFAGYGPRLQFAIEQVRDGEHQWLTTPTIDSYHTVWFELHEDLLQSQGIERSERT